MPHADGSRCLPLLCVSGAWEHLFCNPHARITPSDKRAGEPRSSREKPNRQQYLTHLQTTSSPCSLQPGQLEACSSTVHSTWPPPHWTRISDTTLLLQRTPCLVSTVISSRARLVLLASSHLAEALHGTWNTWTVPGPPPALPGPEYSSLAYPFHPSSTAPGASRPLKHRRLHAWLLGCHVVRHVLLQLCMLTGTVVMRARQPSALIPSRLGARHREGEYKSRRLKKTALQICMSLHA